MSRPVASGSGNKRDNDATARDRHSKNRERDGGRHRRDSPERSSHRRRKEETRDNDGHEQREERRDSDRRSDSKGDDSRGGDRDREKGKDSDSEDDRRPSRSHRSKRTRDDGQSEDSVDDDRRERKHKKHHKEKKHKHRRTDRHPTTQLEQRIQQAKQSLALLSSSSPTASTVASSSPPVLTSDDYWSRSAEFRLWLHNSRSLHLDELDGEKARQLFDEFCSEWNGQRLLAMYYKGIDSSALSGSVLTGHKWRFVSAMSEEDKLANASVRDSVDTATHHHSYQQEFTPAAGTATAATSLSSTAIPPAAAAAVPAAATVPPPSSRPFHALSKGEKRQHFRTVEAVLDEVAPRETGREAMLLKRREKSEYSRRERGGDGMDEVDDEVLMGGGSGEGELARLKQRDHQRREKHNQQQAEKRSEWDRKERDRMKAMLQSIGQADKYNL